MDTTRATLIRRVRQGDDSVAWSEFYRLYSGLVYRYARTRGLNDADSADVVGQCMAALSQRMRVYQYDRQRCKFRSYLRNMANKEIAALLRKMRPQQADSTVLRDLQAKHSAPDELWDRHWEISHLMFCWSLIEREVQPLYAEAFRLAVIEELPTKQVADQLGITPNHLYQIKARMHSRLAETVREIMGDED